MACSCCLLRGEVLVGAAGSFPSTPQVLWEKDLLNCTPLLFPVLLRHKTARMSAPASPVKALWVSGTHSHAQIGVITCFPNEEAVVQRGLETILDRRVRKKGSQA
jgi:hypothetical protein